jgi:hypothetical protein
VLVRGDTLGATMSEDLVTKLQATPNLFVRLRTEVIDGLRLRFDPHAAQSTASEEQYGDLLADSEVRVGPRSS